uniref:Sulfatase-modifying factor enzyme 1 n=1 Tax=Candidatus Kentrum sp. MB TaxID=2138164 RepID=A0A450XV30_9GAMM|nr:MAG: Sulfatase-modifying factor enzyme 1 [Candidatus Kentron sp. MB]VFK76028.1 MAG: Sulfatase-modifying factor enzyme 1 [Candidatus Kentron sp. MB]
MGNLSYLIGKAIEKLLLAIPALGSILPESLTSWVLTILVEIAVVWVAATWTKRRSTYIFASVLLIGGIIIAITLAMMYYKTWGIEPPVPHETDKAASHIKPVPDNPTPQETEPRIPPNTLHIPQDPYPIPGNLSFLLGTDPVTIKIDFYIQKSEVTVGDFRPFFDTLSKAQQNALYGWDEWGEEGPVANITWQLATDYAKWRSKQTGHHWRLPDKKEWMVALIKLKVDPNKAILGYNTPTDDKGNKRPERAGESGSTHLFANLREWSWEPCITSNGEKGHFTHGKSYHADPNKLLNVFLCYARSSHSLGFRLVSGEPPS